MQKGLTVHDRDLFKQPLSESELGAPLADRPPEDAFAWNSPRAGARGLSRRAPPAGDDPVRMMLETPCLVRRPAVGTGRRTAFGPNRQELGSLIT